MNDNDDNDAELEKAMKESQKLYDDENEFEPGSCNDPKEYLQNNADGNCLFEAISQIYFENDFEIDRDKFARENKQVQLQLRKLTALFFSRCQENKYKQHACNLDHTYCFNGMNPTDNIYGEEIDLLLLSILFKFKFKVMVNAVDTHYLQTIPKFESIDSEPSENKYVYTFCNTKKGLKLQENEHAQFNHWVLKKHNTPKNRSFQDRLREATARVDDDDQVQVICAKINSYNEHYLTLLSAPAPSLSAESKEEEEKEEVSDPAPSSEQEEESAPPPKPPLPVESPPPPPPQPPQSPESPTSLPSDLPSIPTEEEENKLSVKSVVIYIFVNQLLLICIKNDQDYKDEDSNETYKAHVVPVGIFDSTVTDDDAFNQTLAQAGFKMPDKFDIQNRRLEYNDTIYVNQKSYYLFIDNIPAGYFVNSATNNNKFFDYTIYQTHSSSCAVSLIPLVEISGFVVKYKNYYIETVSNNKDKFIRQIIFNLDNPKNPTTSLTNELIVIPTPGPTSGTTVKPAPALTSAPSIPAPTLTPMPTLRPTPTPRPTPSLTPAKKDAIYKKDKLNSLKIEQDIKQQKLKMLKQELDSLRLNETTTLTQINSLEQILKNDGLAPEVLGKGTEMQNTPTQFKAKREEAERKQQEAKVEQQKLEDTIKLKNRINEDSDPDSRSGGLELLAFSLKEKNKEKEDRAELQAKIKKQTEELKPLFKELQELQEQKQKQKQEQKQESDQPGIELTDTYSNDYKNKLEVFLQNQSRLKEDIDRQEELKKEEELEKQEAKEAQEKVEEEIKEEEERKQDVISGKINGDEEIQSLQSSLVNTRQKIEDTSNKIDELTKEIDELTQQIKEAEGVANIARQKAAQEAQVARQKASQDAQVANVLYLEEKLNNTINSVLLPLSGITTKTNWFLFIAFIIIIILLSVLLHYNIIEYTPFLIIMCFVLATPIIIYLFTDNKIDAKLSPKINNKNKYYMLFTIFMIFMSICALILLLNNGSFPTTPMPGEFSAQENQTNSEIVFSIIAFLIVLGCICWFLLSMSEFKELFEGLYQISNVLYVIIYIIFLIIFFYLTSKDTQNTYAAIIFPVLILLGMASFMYSFKQSTFFGSKINVNYERIKYFILLLSLITIIIIFYTINPGGYMTKYFGQTFSVAIAMMVFGFLFLVFSINLSDSTSTSTSTSTKTSSLISVFNRDKFVIYNILVFIIFIIIVVAGIVYFPGGFENNPMSILIIILLLIIFTGWVLFFGIKIFTNETENLVPSLTSFSNKSDAMKRILIMVFGLIFSSLLIVWLIGTFQNFTSRSTIAAGILNTLMIIFVLSLVYKILTIGTNYIKTPTKFQQGIDFVLSVIFYIPCLITSPFDFFSSTSATSSSTTKPKIVYEYTPTIKNAFVLFVMIIILWILSLILPFIEKRVNLQGGTQIISNPISTNNESVVASYEKLNGNNDLQYQYGMSFWVFINAFSPSTNSNYNKFTSLLNYGDKPNILYNGSTNTLMITMKNNGLQNKLTDVDDNNNRILYKEKNVLLQKWNNITLNYTGGTLDIFVNGKLVKSDIEVIPYITLDNLIVGTNHGIDGGICNLVYFTNPLTITNVYYLYETLKNTTPPFIKTL